MTVYRFRKRFPKSDRVSYPAMARTSALYAVVEIDGDRSRTIGHCFRQAHGIGPKSRRPWVFVGDDVGPRRSLATIHLTAPLYSVLKHVIIDYRRDEPIRRAERQLRLEARPRCTCRPDPDCPVHGGATG